MLEIELLGAPDAGARAPAESSVRRLCALAAAAADVHDGHLAIELVPEARIVALNAEHRGKAVPTDVLSFPIDGAARPPDGVPRELGDVVICPPHTEDLATAIVHGVLHLVGLDHECDDGEMLALQAEILRWERL
ncbi:MAG TPA: rRNA maturation RNase YbeY [Solirubrobacteraceae bacterium]|nr:rRNA maturation RNase YbeY [Solirubrobacteraceae bacterium]